MATITLRNVVKRFGTAQILHGLDLEIRGGELTVLLGPSGCGKSTLLRMIAGLEDVTEGDILIDGKRVNDVDPKDRGCAMVFQNYALYPHKSVWDNLAFPLRMAGVPKPVIASKVEAIARQLEIAPLLKRRPKDLSGGQRQRVAMGRAMIREPRVFLFDEPLSNLDAELRVRLRLEIARMQRTLRASMVFVTHDQVEAMTLAHCIVVMREGRIEQTGTPLEIYHKPANRFVAGFIGSPTMNVLPVEAAEKRDGTTTIRVAGDIALSLGRPIGGVPRHVGIRPEHVTLGAAAVENRVTLAPAGYESLGTEHLGDRSYRHVRLDAGEVTFLVTEGSDIDSGDLALGFPPQHLYLFDEHGRVI